MSQEPKVTRFGVDPLVPQELATKAYVDAGTGGGLTFARVVKPADETLSNSTVLQDDDDLLATLNINKTYSFIYLLIYLSSTTNDFKFGMSVPAGATMAWYSQVTAGRADEDETDSIFFSADGVNLQLAFGTGQIIMGGTAGDFNVQWAQNTASAGVTTVKEGSYIVVWEET